MFLFKLGSKEVLHKFKDSSRRDGVRTDTVILWILNVTLLRRYLPMASFIPYMQPTLTRQKEEAGEKICFDLTSDKEEIKPLTKPLGSIK